MLSYTPGLKVLSYSECCGGLEVYKQIFKQISCFGSFQLLGTEWIRSSGRDVMSPFRLWHQGALGHRADVTGNCVWAEPRKLLGGVCAMDALGGVLGAHLLTAGEPISSPGASLQKDGWLCPQGKLEGNWPMISLGRSPLAEGRVKIRSLFLEIWTE